MSCHVSTRLVHQHSHRYPMDCLTSTCVSGVATGVLARGTLLSWMFAVSLRWALAVNAKKCVTTLFNLSCQVLSTFDPRADLAMSSLLSEHASLPLDMPFLPCYPIAVPHNTSPASKRSRRQKLWDHASDVTRHRQQPETCEHAHAQKLPMWSRWHGHCWSTQILCGSWTKFVCAVGHEKKWDSDSWQGRTDAYNWDDRAHLRAAAPSLNAWDLEWSLRATLTLKESMLFGNCALLDARVCKYRSEVWSEPRALLETTALDSVHDRFLCELQIFSRIVHRFVVKGFLVFSHNVELSELRQSFRNSTPLRHQVRPLHENFQHYWRSMPWLRCLVGTSVNSRLCRPWWIYLRLIVQNNTWVLGHHLTIDPGLVRVSSHPPVLRSFSQSSVGLVFNHEHAISATSLERLSSTTSIVEDAASSILSHATNLTTEPNVLFAQTLFAGIMTLSTDWFLMVLTDWV